MVITMITMYDSISLRAMHYVGALRGRSGRAQTAMTGTRRRDFDLAEMPDCFSRILRYESVGSARWAISQPYLRFEPCVIGG